MGSELKQVSHEHPLLFNTESNIGGDSDEEIMKCEGCLKQISRPFYSCKQCDYALHKVCAELPVEMKHPSHPSHPLTLIHSKRPSSSHFWCDLCGGACENFLYRCSICDFDVDIICAAASRAIEDKCHSHPLTPLQLSISFPCNICGREEKGISYKCCICSFWVHQKCTLLPSTIKHGDHHHPLTFAPSIPSEYWRNIKYCDICHSGMPLSGCVYYCARCLFFAHANCAALKTQSLRDENTEDQDNVLDQCPVLLPVRKESTDLITRFVENRIPLDIQLKNKIKHFGHGHPLFLFDEQIINEICEACVHPISPPSYGCLECGYFLHKCCTELPQQLLHPFHPNHQLDLFAQFPNSSALFYCNCCYKWCNGFGYKCSECKHFVVDIMCGSLLGPLRHEGHKHALIPRILSSYTCSVCICTDLVIALQCDVCNFTLCPVCAMLPPTMCHRYDKHPFTLTYSPIENHDHEYLCEVCEEYLNPKCWFYHCGLCDQSIHSNCMLTLADDSCIKYGGIYKDPDHQHKLTLVPFTRNYSNCNYCRAPLNKKFVVGFECAPCDFRLHLKCIPSSLSNCCKLL